MVPRTQTTKDYVLIAAKTFPFTMIFGVVGFNDCSAIPKLTTAMVVFGVMNTVIGLVTLWYNIPDDMTEKDKIKKANSSHANILNFLDLFSLSFLGVSIWGFILMAPHVSELPNGPDGCEAVFLCGFISFAIPTVIVAGLLGYVLMVAVKKALGMEVIWPWETPEESSEAMTKNGASPV
ncbi:hypothetical protein TrST_g13304 [Triparma strigata]|uniref:Uncharacterized protein n=1 Tax=Triparma strigata TaxID=1606541 RepID=A0A9W7BAQ6_9STRA|nr:hypothetical protein TrST_g13304 [Triparma strigata]